MDRDSGVTQKSYLKLLQELGLTPLVGLCLIPRSPPPFDISLACSALDLEMHQSPIRTLGGYALLNQKYLRADRFTPY
jgi:hypothetical protein